MDLDLSVIILCVYRPVARGGQLTPLENQRSTFWNLAREIIKANNYEWLTIYLHQLLCTKPPTKWLQNLLSKGGSGAKVKFNQNICFLESVSAASSVLMCTEEVQDSPRNSSLLVKLHFGRIAITPN